MECYNQGSGLGPGGVKPWTSPMSGKQVSVHVMQELVGVVVVTVQVVMVRTL